MRILLALDTSAGSQAALDEVAARPWPANSSLDVISVVEPNHLWTTTEVAQEASRLAQEVVERAVKRLCSAGLAVSGTALAGDPKTVILDRARTENADLIVVGSQGASAVERLLLGDVAATVLRYAACSVEIARAPAEPKQPGPMKILLATDGSPFSEWAAESIAVRPWPAGTEVRILSVVEMVLPPIRALFEVPAIDEAYIETAREQAI